jgi:competence protein ComEC
MPRGTILTLWTCVLGLQRHAWASRGEWSMPLVAHFLNVGRGDCTIIQFPSGRTMMVDIDNLTEYDQTTKEEVLREFRSSAPFTSYTLGEQQRYLRKAESTLTNPFAYLDTYIGRYQSIFRCVITHPDMDHMTGLFELARTRTLENFWHTGPHDFNLADTTTADWSKSPYNQADWEAYKILRDSTSNPKGLQLYQGASNHYWAEDGIEIWAPTPELETLAVDRDESNIISMILKISYKGRSIVLGGDATSEETWPTIWPYIDMSGITVLKASHHGRKSGYYQPAVKEMAPWLTITSVGEAEYDATRSYRQYSEHTVSLRKSGDIRFTINDDGSCTYYPPNLPDVWKDKLS